MISEIVPSPAGGKGREPKGGPTQARAAASLVQWLPKLANGLPDPALCTRELGETLLEALAGSAPPDLIRSFLAGPLDLRGRLRFSVVGEVCRQQREARGATLKEAARACRLRQRDLRQIEGSQVEFLSGEVLRRYADWLGLRDWLEQWLRVNGDLAGLYGWLEGAAPAKAVGAARMWRMKVTLKQLRPAVWRRFLISDRSTLEGLHDTLQVVMGWFDSHLHEFGLPGFQTDPDDDSGERQRRRERVRLAELDLEPKSRFTYLYDFGDSWTHEVVLERILPVSAGQLLPWCVGGANACPPEDCGGVWGYAELIEILRDPSHPEHRERWAWLGHALDPIAFDPALVNARLHPRLKPSQEAKS